MTSAEDLERLLGDDFRLDEWQVRVMDSALERSRDRQLEDLWRSANPPLPRGGWRADRVVWDEASAWFAEPTPLELVERIVAANADRLPATVARAGSVEIRVCPRQYGKGVRREGL